MKNYSFFLFLILVSFHAMAESQSHSGKPSETATSSGHYSSSASHPLLYLSSDKNKKDKNIVNSRENEIKRLKECGFEVRDFEVSNTQDFKQQVSSGHFPKDTPVFISASHGDGKLDEQSNNRLHIDPEGNSIPAATLIDTVRGLASSAPIYLDVCHAGLCRDGKCQGIGTACGSEESSDPEESHKEGGSVDKFPVTEAMIDLWCDSIKDCSNFDQFDKNLDGILDGTEINQFLGDTFKKQNLGGLKPRVHQSEFKNWEEAQKAEANCKSSGTHFECKGDISKFDIKFSSLPPPQKSSTPVIELLAAGTFRKRKDIPTTVRPGMERKEFDELTSHFLAQKWPSSNLEQAREAVEKLTGISFESYTVSEDGKELTGQDQSRKNHRLRLDNFSNPQQKPMILCDCVTNEGIPEIATVGGRVSQQVFFDPEYKISCRGKRKK
jgi:hypothetical protein